MSQPKNSNHRSKTWKKVVSWAKMWIRRVRQTRVDHELLAKHWAELGIRPSGCVLVHSSLSAIGYCVGGADTVIDSLLEYLGPSGTLVFPTHTWRTFNRGARDFDVRRTPSQVGRISEIFRLRSNAIRSLHPTHSVSAIGPGKDELVRDHLLSSGPCGANSPYARLMDCHGQILLLGVGLKNNTCFHTVEALAEVPYLLRPENDHFRIVDYDDQVIEADVRCHAKAQPSRFTSLEEPLTKHGCLRKAKIGDGSSMLIEAHAFRELLLPVLRAQPELLLESCSSPIDF